MTSFSDLNSSCVIATRQSPLALWQARHVQALLQAQAPRTTFVLLPLVTRGDELVDALNWRELSSRGLFVKRLEQSIASGEAFCAVHSLKDVPHQLPEGFELVWMGARENPADAFVSERYASLQSVPEGGVIGTSSIRRSAQLKFYRPDLNIVPIRGNVATRLRKLKEQSLDGIILAAAGLIRLGLIDRITEYLPFSICLPSPGQGFLAIEAQHNPIYDDWWHSLHNPEEILLALIERRTAALLGADCNLPFAAHAFYDDGHRIRLMARLLSPDGVQKIEFSDVMAPDENAEQLANRAVQHLQRDGFSLLKVSNHDRDA